MENKQTDGTSLRSHVFTFDYPKRAAEAILRNAEYLEKLIPDFGWQVDLFAGYDIVPEDYQAQGKRQVSGMQGTVKGRRC